MSATSIPCLVADDDEFTCYNAAADATNLARLRDELARWLHRRAGVERTRALDVVLAVNEALANAAEFAYLQDGPGTVNLEVVLDPARRTLFVTVSDRGRWRQVSPVRRQRRRGRGIPLMRVLADSVVIDTSSLGTSVLLRFDGVAARATGVLPIIRQWEPI